MLRIDAAGYPEHTGGEDLGAKFNPFHDEAGRFTFGPNGGGPRAPDGTPVDPAAKKPTPLVHRTARGLSTWLAPAWGGALDLRADRNRK